MSDDYAGAAMGASIRKVGVVPPAVTASSLDLDGGVAGRFLWPVASSPSFPPPAVLLI